MKNLFIIFILLPGIVLSQKDSTKQNNNAVFFANIYTNAYFQKTNTTQKKGFYLHTGLFGYSNKIASNIKGTIIFDVTRTTNSIQVTDTNGNNLQVNFFEGSKYTAYLKMAAIEWKFYKNFSLLAGQLLNTQYLTFQDKYWEHRYVEVTFQELNKFGMPADFGIQFNYEKTDKIKIELGAFNGEGPFKHQDENSNFIVSGNIEFKPIKQVVFKIYAGNHFSGIDTLNNKQIFSFFGGFKTEKFTIGAEYDLVNNSDFIDKDLSGLSVFAFYNFTKKLQIFYRYDFIIKSQLYQYKSLHIGGFEYRPVQNFFISCNYRNFNVENTNSIYLSLGIKF